MQSHRYAILAALVFTIVAVLHAARLFYRWPVVIGSTQIPMALSWVAVVVTGLLALAGFTSARS